MRPQGKASPEVRHYRWTGQVTIQLRHEAPSYRREVRSHLDDHRSDRLKLRAVRPGGAVSGGSSPDNVGRSPAPSDGSCPLARRKGVGDKPVLEAPLLSSGSKLMDTGRMQRLTRSLNWRAISAAEHGFLLLRLQGNCDCFGAMLQGYSWAPTPPIGKRMNVGTLSMSPRLDLAPSESGRQDPPPVEGMEGGRRLRSTPSLGKPNTWGREPAGLQRHGWGGGRR